MRTFDGRWLALAAVLVMAACTCGRPEGKECTGDGSCDPGQICGAMKICEIQKVCPELPCATDQVCVNARCLNTKCGAVQCAMNQVCSGGVCTDISCVGKSCPGGTCIGGSCYPNEGCEFASCVPNTEICIADTCVPTKCLGVTCPGDQRCAADGKCYPRGGTGGNSGTGPGPDGDGGFGAGGFGGGNGSGGSSGGSSGTGGSSGGSSGTGGSSGGSSGTGGSSGGSSGTGGSGGGSGIGACNGMCTPLQVCINNQCVETRCVGVSCPAGQACSNGQCVPTGCGVNGAMCPPGQVCSSTGTCVDPSCGNVSCPTSYYCRGGLCTLQLPDGGYPQEADGGGTTVVVNPNGGGVIGIKGPDGGLLIGSDGGAIGAPCLPGKCDEVICNNNVDENGNGLSDCADPACNTRSCDDGNRCTFAERCVAGACQPARTVTCNTPPPGQCWSNPGVCTPMETCEYDLALGKACTSPSNYVCGVDGGCVPQAVQPGLFNYVPSNFDPATLSPVSRAAIPAGEMVTLNTSTQQITGNWNPQPAFQVVTTSTGEALVASARDMSFGTGSYLRVVGSRPLILVAFSVFEVKGTIDVSANGATPGPGGDVNCGSSNGGNGSFGLLSAAGAGGAGAPGGNNRWGGNGGGGSTFATLGSGGAPRNDAATALVGGCHGGTGGTAGVTTGGIGGAGGGVLQISVSSGFNINGGTLLANGGFGSAGSPGNNESRGGGGGGSGGKILIEGQYVLSQPTGRIQANGGGGGEGTGWTYGGRNGGQPDVYQVLWGGQGGNGAWFNAGNGGDGGGWWQAAGYHGQSALSFLFGENNASSWESGGGGGGGSAGAIYVRVGGTDNQCVLRSDRVTHSPRLATNSADNCGL